MADETDSEIGKWTGAEGTADLQSEGFKDGNLVLTFVVHPESKYDLLPITDIKGRSFRLKITTESTRVFAGRQGLEDAKRRVKAARKAADDE